MNAIITRDGEEVASISTNPVSIDGNPPPIVEDAVKAKSTKTVGGDNPEEVWEDPSDSEIKRRLISTLVGSPFNVTFD